MRIAFEIADEEVREICELTGEKKKGPAIRKLLSEALMLKRREAMTEKFLTGEWRAELEGYEASRATDRKHPG